METHVPRGGVHSIKQFVVEVAMIVLGVLIALGVEQARQSFHERKIAQEARENFRREIDLERNALKFYFDHMQAPRDSLQKFLETEKAVKPAGSKPASYKEPIWQYLPTGGWDAAAAMQAFAYMDPAEVQRYTLVHTGQMMFNRFADQMQPILADLNSFQGRSDLTVEEQRRRNHDIRLVLGYLESIDQAGHELMLYFDESTKGVATKSQ
jgi:hypothetical protein